VNRHKRQELIRRVLVEGPVASQDALRERLAALGVGTTQATLSRDIRAMGIVKGPTGYRLPGPTPEARRGGAVEVREREPGQSAVAAYSVEIATGGALVVIHTAPGHAQVVALELDRLREPPIVGTVAGDDTVFVATPSEPDADLVCERLRRESGLPGGERTGAGRSHADASGAG